MWIRGFNLQKVCIIDSQSEFPAFKVREYFNYFNYFDYFNIDCFISNNSKKGNIDIKLFVSDKEEALARVLLDTFDLSKSEDGCPMCGTSNYISGSSIIHKLFNLKRKNSDYCCRYCQFKWPDY